ncbi:MAG: CDP-alcohol phosphatidyltransferase family protein [Micromonosporaceae bacterium]
MAASPVAPWSDGSGDAAALSPAASRPAAADFLASNRGGGLFSEAVNQRLGAYLALSAHRLGLAPTHLTLASLLIGAGSSLGVTVLAPRAAAGDVPSWLVGLAALLAWHLAYSLDCADGQLARVTGRASAAGARVDILCDVAVHICLVTALAATAVAHAPDTPAWFVALFAGTWMVNLVTSVLAGGAAAGSLITSGSLPVRVLKLSRDFGALLTAYALVIAIIPQWTVWAMAGSAGVNGAFLALSIGQAVRASLRHSAP